MADLVMTSAPRAVAPSTHRTPLRALAAACGAALLLFGSSWSGAGAEDTTSVLVHDVAVQAFAYQPTTITVPVGSVVLWTNLDPVDHTVTDVDGQWDSGIFGNTATFSKTFDAPGSYTYYCIPHPMMFGTVEVTG